MIYWCPLGKSGLHCPHCHSFFSFIFLIHASSSSSKNVSQNSPSIKSKLKNGWSYSLYLLISSGEIIPDLDWIVDDDVEVAACVEHSININDHVVKLRHSLKSRQEALICSLRGSLRRGILQGDDAAVDERDEVVGVEGLALHGVHLLGADEMVTLIDKPLESNILGVSNDLVLPAATTLLDDGGVVELPGYWVNKSDEAVAVRALQLSPDMTHVVSRGAGHVPGLSLVDGLPIHEKIRLEVCNRGEKPNNGNIAQLR